MTREQQKLLSSGGGAGDGGKGTNVDSTPVDDSSDDGSEETKEKKLKYNIKDLEHFSINKEKIELKELLYLIIQEALGLRCL